MDQKINEILKVIDFYVESVENPETFQNMDMEYMKKGFQACVFIEKLIKKIEIEKKEASFESHVNMWMMYKKKNLVYNCSDFKNACDKFLEFCLKNEKLPVEVVDELIKMFIEEHGSTRLEFNINRILSNSMQTNVILQLIKNLNFPESDIEDEVLIASWDHKMILGRHKKVIEHMKYIFHKPNISRLINLAYKAERNSKVNILILDYFTKKLTNNHVQLYSELGNTKKKVLLKLLTDHPKFQTSFIDETFLIGKNMEHDEEEMWITQTGLNYNDLQRIIKILLDGPHDLYKITMDRIKIAKEDVWEDIKRDCIL